MPFAGSQVARVAALVAVALLLVTGCSAESGEAPEPTSVEHLAIDEVTYNCATQVLVVSGKARPARANQGVQVQVRSIEHPRAPVWRIADTTVKGEFETSGHYVVSPGKNERLVVRLGAVVDGERVFSARSYEPVRCR